MELNCLLLFISARKLILIPPPSLIYLKLTMWNFFRPSSNVGIYVWFPGSVLSPSAQNFSTQKYKAWHDAQREVLPLKRHTLWIYNAISSRKQMLKVWPYGSWNVTKGSGSSSDTRSVISGWEEEITSQILLWGNDPKLKPLSAVDLIVVKGQKENHESSEWSRKTVAEVCDKGISLQC